MQVNFFPVFYYEADMTWCDSKISYRHHSLLSSVINWVETLFLGALRYGSIRGNGFSFTFDCAALIYVLYSAENGRPLQNCVVTQKKMPHHHLISCWNGLPSDTKHRQGRAWMTLEVIDTGRMCVMEMKFCLRWRSFRGESAVFKTQTSWPRVTCVWSLQACQYLLVL